MYKPENCTYPDCFHCPLPDCEYSETDRLRDKWAADMRRKRRERPEQYLNAQRAYKARVELRDPGHFARLQREKKKKKKGVMESVTQ